MADWITFWNSANSIYVNARHRDVHYRTIADDLAAYVPGKQALVIDYGCGEALHADRVAAAAGKLILSDAADTVRAGLTQRFAAVPNITVRSPDEIAAMDDAQADLIVMHSVAQYLSEEQLRDVLSLFHRLLKPDGLFILGDVIPPGMSPVTDVTTLLRFAAHNGFFGAALVGLARTVFSDYTRLRSTIGLSLYEEPKILALLRAAGFNAARDEENIGHNPARMTFLARPRGPSGA